MANTVPSCYRSNVTLLRAASLSVAALVLGACSRTGFDDFSAIDGVGGATPPGVDSGIGGSVGTVVSPVPTSDASVLPIVTVTDAGRAPPGPPVSKPPTKTAPGCVPHAEVCNGIDDDCNGVVDDGLPPIPCASGGDQYCVAGRYSACPSRCETCIPGSERVCFLSYCAYWATETCAADGRSFGTCKESPVPPECAAVSSEYKDSRQLEQCCVDHGYCCHDDYDLDGDGDHDDMVGQCGEVTCSP